MKSIPFFSNDTKKRILVLKMKKKIQELRISVCWNFEEQGSNIAIRTETLFFLETFS